MTNKKLILIGVIAAICIAPIIFFPWLILQYELPKVVFFNIITVVIGVLLSLEIFSSKKLLVPKVKRPLVYLSGLYLLIALLSSILSIDPHLSFYGSYIRQQGFFQMIFYLLFLFEIVLFFSLYPKDKKKIKNKLIVSLCITATLVSLLAILQKFYMPRPQLTFGQPGFLASYLLMTIPLIFYQIKKTDYKFLYSTAFFINIVAILSTASRSAIATLVIVIVLIFIISREDKKLLLIPLAILTLFLSANLFSSTEIVQKNIMLRRFTPATTDMETLEIRFLIWPATVEQILYRPLLGYGPETLLKSFEDYYPEKLRNYEGGNMAVDIAHNILLDQAFSYGILGLVSFISVFAYMFYLVFRNKEFTLSKVAALSIFGLFIYNLFNFSTTTNYILTAFFLGIIISETFSNTKLKIPQSLAAKLVIILLLIGGPLITNIREVSADYYFNKAKQEATNKNHIRSAQHFRRAINLNPNERFYFESAINYSQLVIDNAPSQYTHIFEDHLMEFEKAYNEYYGKINP